MSSTYTDPARIRAVETFEGALGRQLDIVQTYHKWTDPFPTEIDRWVADRGDILLLSWAGTKPSEIVDGRYDSMIRKRAEALQKLGTPVLLRWRWEMNRPNLRTEIPTASGYVEAWKHIRNIFDDVGPDNVDWVWCPSANGFEETNGAEYYPGDDEVEWLCADAYTPYPNTPLEQVLAPFLDWAESHADKPIVIGEFGTREGEARSTRRMARRRDGLLPALQADQGCRLLRVRHRDGGSLRHLPGTLRAGGASKMERDLMAEPGLVARELSINSAGSELVGHEPMQGHPLLNRRQLHVVAVQDPQDGLGVLWYVVAVLLEAELPRDAVRRHGH